MTNSPLITKSKAFAHCSKLTSINIPTSLTTLHGEAFWSSHSIKKVNIDNLAAWCSLSIDSNHSYFENPLTGASLYQNGEPVTDLVIPDGVTRIGSRLFSCCQTSRV